MLIKLFLCFCLVASSYSWLAPERCAQNSRGKRSVVVSRTARSATNVNDIAAAQKENLKRTYKNHEFIGVPIRATGKVYKYMVSCPPYEYEIHAPFNCTFHTYDPRLLSSVICSDATCKLSHTVSTVDTYSASEGYNWGVKISTKLTIIDKVFEVGGEASTGGTYSCTYNKGRTVTDLVECSASSVKSGLLQLYTVKSDINCEFGGITLRSEVRKSSYYGIFDGISYVARGSSYTSMDIEELRASSQVTMQSCSSSILLDTSKVSDRLFQKLMRSFPLYNAYTDLLMIDSEFIRVYYYEKISTVPEYRRIIPFTNEGGDSVYQYVCIKSEDGQ